MIRNRPSRGWGEQLETLFATGTCAGMTDGELLARYLAAGAPAGAQSFEALVTRHGPMVARVCRNMLDDPTDIHDAWQAVFLVLAKRASAIRNQDSIGGWLHGVAVRVAARVRAGAVRREIRDRRDTRMAIARAQLDWEPPGAGPAAAAESAAIVHQEVNRLPEKYRAPIVLCYLEGLTHDEAAARLCCPVGTVRSRLSRARDRLRDRLTRQGVTAPAVLGPLTCWLAGTPAASEASPAIFSAEIATTVAQGIAQLVDMPAATAVSRSTQIAQGVLNAMMLKKSLIAMCFLVPLGFSAAGGGLLWIQSTQAQDQKPAAASSTQKPPGGAPYIVAPASSTQKPPGGPPYIVNPASSTQKPLEGGPYIVGPKPPEVDPLVKKLVDTARARMEFQREVYEQGRITIDRFIDSCRQFERASLQAATTDAERRAIRERSLALLKEILQREESELLVGRGTQADVAEASQVVAQAELEWKTSQQDADEKRALLERMNKLEEQVKELKAALLKTLR